MDQYFYHVYSTSLSSSVWMATVSRFLPELLEVYNPYRSDVNCSLPSGLQRPGIEIALEVHHIPKRLLKDPYTNFNVDFFVQIMRGKNKEIDTESMDITLDPFASEYVWQNMTSMEFRSYPDLQRLACQLGSHIKKVYEPKCANVDGTKCSQFNYRKMRENHQHVIQQRETDLDLILIDRAIYSRPSLIPQDYHKAAESFALNASCFQNLEQPLPGHQLLNQSSIDTSQRSTLLDKETDLQSLSNAQCFLAAAEDFALTTSCWKNRDKLSSLSKSNNKNLIEPTDLHWPPNKSRTFELNLSENTKNVPASISKYRVSSSKNTLMAQESSVCIDKTNPLASFEAAGPKHRTLSSLMICGKHQQSAKHAMKETANNFNTTSHWF